jgi:hypothetical protein
MSEKAGQKLNGAIVNPLARQPAKRNVATILSGNNQPRLVTGNAVKNPFSRQGSR